MVTGRRVVAVMVRGNLVLVARLVHGRMVLVVVVGMVGVVMVLVGHSLGGHHLVCVVDRRRCMVVVVARVHRLLPGGRVHLVLVVRVVHVLQGVHCIDARVEARGRIGGRNRSHRLGHIVGAEVCALGPVWCC